MTKDIKNQERVIARIKKELVPLKKQKDEASRLLALAQKKYDSAVKMLLDRKSKGLPISEKDLQGKSHKTLEKMWETIGQWDSKKSEFERQYHVAHHAMLAKEEEILAQESVLAQLFEDHQLYVAELSSTIEKTFALNAAVVTAMEEFKGFLDLQVYPFINDDGTQKTIDDVTGTKRVVIMSNTSISMESAKVTEAKQYIDEFFKKFSVLPEENASLFEDQMVRMLADLLKELLVFKFSVKPGPSLSTFLSFEFDGTFPELKKAQTLLSEAIRNVRSSLYVRLYERDSEDKPWKQVKKV